MPWQDWQFYVVTAAAAWGAWTVARQLLPKTGPTGPVCGGCGTGVAACACAKKPPAAAGEASASPLVVLQSRSPKQIDRSS